jgi:hypothetical protein
VHDQFRLGAYLVLVFGVLLLLASLFADPLGLGQPGTSFGWKQMLGTVLGLAVIGGGIVLLRRLNRPT